MGEGLASTIREAVEAVKHATGTIGNLVRNSDEEPVDLEVWMPAEKVGAYLGILPVMADDMIRSGKLKSITRTYKFLKNRQLERITATFVDKAQVEELYRQSIFGMKTVVEGSHVRIESDQKSTPPMVVQPSEKQPVTEQATEWVPIRTPWRPGN